MSENLGWETHLRIDQICTQFENECRAGRIPEIEPYLEGWTGVERAKLWSLLIKLADEYRAKRATMDNPDETISNGQPPSGSPQADWPSIPGYRIVAELGRGGMGVVYKAWNEKLKRVEAIKVARGGAEDKARFDSEVEKVGGLDHPHIVTVYGSGEAQGRLYLAMRYAEGGSLAKRMEKGPKFAPSEAARLVVKIAAAIDYAHKRGVLHRDLKPGNILLDANDEPMVADFGLAKRLDASDPMTDDGVIVGTWGYMAPEQARGERNLTIAADIFGVGAVLYALLTGDAPFTGSRSERLERTEECSPTWPDTLNPAVDADLAAVCMRCLEGKPGDRYQNAAELMQELDRYIHGEPVHTRPPGFVRFVRRALRIIVRQDFRNARQWGWVNLLGGFLLAGSYLASAWGIAAEQPPSVLIAIGLGQITLYTAICVALLRRRAFNVGDRHALTLIVGLSLASTLLPVVYRPELDADLSALTAYRLSLYPLLALLYGLAYFMMGSAIWGGFYVYAASFFVLARVMKMALPLAPVIFAIFIGVTQIWIGLYLLRQRPN